MKRSSGILMHISSLPSPYGIGTLGASAREFVDFLRQAGQSYWQILPIGPTSYGDSPYQSFSVFAGNPYFIDLDTLVQEGLLTKQECSAKDWGDNPRQTDYAKLFQSRPELLRLAWQRDRASGKDWGRFLAFRKEHGWTEDYGLYMAVKQRMNLKAWREWDEEIRLRRPDALAAYREEEQDQIEYYIWVQYQFYRQWAALKSYANRRGVKLIGDIPIYVAEDSADTWANPGLFEYDSDCRPIEVAGCPPDYFSKTGQLWGNPLYRWDRMKEDGYRWWIKRICAMSNLFDVTRIDHFRGFESYYAIPAGNKTAEIGRWKKGPGLALFQAIRKELGNIQLIAEDLGFITDEVIALRDAVGYPGMKILEFAFSADTESSYLPHNCVPNSVMYTGTHDNNTARGWIQDVSYREFRHACDYLNCRDRSQFNWDLIRGAWGSVCNLAVAQMQDFLNLGSWARMNLPSTLGGNWQWRMLKKEMSPELASQIRELTSLYGRLPKKKQIRVRAASGLTHESSDGILCKPAGSSRAPRP